MAPRVFWKGYLKLSLVTCPVTMKPATSAAGTLRFHTLNAKTGNRVVSQYVDAETGDPVEDDDQAKGFPTAENDYVILDDDEIDAVALDSTRTIDIEHFVPASSIGWIWYDTPHFLLPDGKIGDEAFRVIREAMAATKTVGIARLVLYRRERAVLLKPRGKGIVVWTLRYGDEVRPADDSFAGIDDEKPEPGLAKLVDRLIKARTEDWSPEMVSDPVQKNLRALIEAKSKGRKRKAKPVDEAAEPPKNVVNIMDALKKSLAAEKK